MWPDLLEKWNNHWKEDNIKKRALSNKCKMKPNFRGGARMEEQRETPLSTTKKEKI